VHVEELVTAFLQEGHTVRVVGPAFYARAGMGAESGLVSLIRRRLPAAMGELAELAYAIPAAWRLWRAARAFKPDLIYERYNLFHLAGALVAWQTGTQLFLEVNSPLADERAAHGGLALARLAHWLERRVWRGADRVLAVTAVLGARIAAAGVDPARIEVVPNAINPDRLLATPARAAPAPLVLGFVGFVRDWHGLDTVIAGLAAAPAAAPDAAPDAALGVNLVVVGDGPARPGLEAQAAALGLGGRVRFTGVVEHALVPALIADFDIALQPRVVDYASPLKIFDYLAAGRAIVAPDQPNIREILEHGRTALLFDPAAPDGMWTAINRLITDPPLRLRLATAAAARAGDYTWRGNARRIAAWAEGEG
jgi:glycosyltransferase involved in cell wall biosynthesis